MPPRALSRYAPIFALALFLCISLVPWHAQPSVRRAAGLAGGMLVLWISESAPLGVAALIVPVAALFCGILTWKEAAAAWGDPIVFLFLGAFLLARALEKHGALGDLAVTRWLERQSGASAVMPIAVVLLASGALSTFQNNTAVAALLLPIAMLLARRSSRPAGILLALAWGATFGGLATPVGTAPNFIGFAAMKKAGIAVTFIDWMRVGVPAWLGTTAIGWIVLQIAQVRHGRREIHQQIAEAPRGSAGGERTRGASGNRSARIWAIAAMALAAGLWLTTGIILSVTTESSATQQWLRRYVPESLVPVLCAIVLFVVRVGPERKAVLDRHDFAAIDWDTLFLIAGGLCLGLTLERSGAADALAAAVRGAEMPPVLLMITVAFATVLLSELTSNTATAALMVPLAASLAQPMGITPTAAIYLVALSASMGFALPVSTPPNAIVFGTGLVPLRGMALCGITVDVLGTAWIVMCVRWFAP